MKFDIRNVIIIALIGAMYIVASYMRGEVRKKEKAIEWLQDTVVTLKDGTKRARVLEGELNDIREVVAAKDKELAKLAKLKGVKSGVVVHTEYVYDTTMIVNTKVDTVTNKVSMEKSYTDEYIAWSVKLKDDSLGVKINVKDSLSIATRTVDRKGLFTGDDLVVDVKNRNKYGDVNKVSSFVVTPKKPNKIIRVLSYVAVAVGAIVLAR